MPHDLVKTKDKLNSVGELSKLTSFEQDLFRCLIWRLQYQLDPNNDEKSLPVRTISERTVRLTREDLLKLIPHSYFNSEEQFLKLVTKATEDIFKTNFKNIWIDADNEDGSSQVSDFYNIFSHIRARKAIKTNRLTYVEFTLNQDCCWLIYNLSEKYTSIYIDNFTAIKGRYAKALYVLLRDWRTKGFWHVDYERFRFLMSVPKSYKWFDVTRRILNPAIGELNSIVIDANSSTPKRTLFTDLYYRPNTKTARGRGGKKVISIDFFFTPEKEDGTLIDKAPVTQKSQAQKKIPTAQAQKDAWPEPAPAAPSAALWPDAPQAENYRPAPAQDTAQNEPQRFNNHDSHGWNEDEINSLANDAPAPSSAPLTALLKDLGIRNFDQLAAAIQSLKSAKK